MQGEWADLTTRQVAERYCYASLMQRREYALFMEHRSNAGPNCALNLANTDSRNGFASLVWEEQAEHHVGGTELSLRYW